MQNLTINGPLTISSGGELIKAGAGRLNVGELLSGGGMTIDAGTTVAGPIKLTSLNLAGPASGFRIQPNSGTAVIGELSIAGGEMPTAAFDLTNNAVVVDFDGTSPATNIRLELLAGRGGTGLGAQWNGLGITSSTAAAANAAEADSRSIGYGENAALPLGPYTSFRGQPVDDSSVLMAFTRTGDANLDGVVDDEDVTIVGATYAPGVPQPHWALGDFDYNGFVDDDDVTLLGVFYDPLAAPLHDSPAVSVTAVPEPGTFLVAVLALALFLVWHCNKRNRCRRLELRLR